MKTEILESYIQFAIDYGYRFPFEDITSFEIKDYLGDFFINCYQDGGEEDYNISLFLVITSKSFIDTVVEGLIKNGKESIIQHYLIDNSYIYDLDNFYNQFKNNFILSQSIAIYNDTLDDFIINLRIGK